MARIRTIKPEFFYNEQVGGVSMPARMLFIGLWTIADREGRLQWSPRRLKAQIFPYDEIEMHGLATELVSASLLTIYDSPEGVCAWIPGFTRHQRPHPKEPESVLPSCPVGAPLDLLPWKNTASRESPGSIPSSPVGREGKGTDKGKGMDTTPLSPHGGGVRVAELSPSRRRFERWWTSYPEKVGKGGAWRAWERVKADDAMTDLMIAAVDQQRRSDRWQRGFIPNPETWLNKQRWLDETADRQALVEAELERFRPKGA